MIDWTRFKWTKGLPGRVLRRRKKQQLARAIDACYVLVDKRDGGVCRFPGCYRPASARHHLVYRSQSVALQADPSNVIDICQPHHDYIHQGWMSVSGDANQAVFWLLTDLGRQAGKAVPFPATYPQVICYP